VRDRLVLALATSLITVFAASLPANASGKKAPAAYAPIPPQIATAKTVFLSNRCEEDYKTCSSVYNDFYTGLSASSRYQLAPSPSTADLIFEIHMVAKTGVTNVVNGTGGSNTYSNLTLTILDNQTRFALWTITEPFSKDSAVKAILFDLQVLSQPNATAGPPQHVAGYIKDHD
jgi:hypothetical protein